MVPVVSVTAATVSSVVHTTVQGAAAETRGPGRLWLVLNDQP